MPPNEKTLYASFTEMEEKVCQRCYFRLFLQNYKGRHCRNCKMQEFKEKLKKYLEIHEDDKK